MKNGIGIYVHIPFCVQKCKYCDFLSFNTNEDIKEKYIEALIKEIELYSNYDIEEKYNVSTIYIGGGTPSSINGEYIEKILECIKKFYNVADNAEITIEVNPGTVTEDKALLYKRIGINRISIGLQSTNNEELKVLGRIHTYEDFNETYNYFRNNGFNNISIDVMSAIPNQTVASYRETLNKIISLKPEHISSYSLIIEENTPFYYQKDKLKLVSEDEERKMYYLTKDILKQHGYNRYEISNYSLEEKASIHNSNYWDVRKYYFGFGIGASSYINEKEYNYNSVRYSKIDNIKKYIDIMSNYEKNNITQVRKIKEKIECDKEIIPVNIKLEEYMYLGLRRMEGISISDFNNLSCNGDIYEIYGEVISKYKNMGLLVEDKDKIYLSDKGIDVCNVIFADFIK